MRITYTQALMDRNYLWGIGPARDMTGGYVEGDAFEELLLNPTKVTARQILTDQIKYWLTVGSELDGSDPVIGVTHKSVVDSYIESDWRVEEIAERYENIL